MSSLDDFFAKKDKKKGKDKSKNVLTPDALVKELEEGASKQPEYHTRKDNKTSGVGIEILGLDADDAGWRDFEDVEKRDYTGLKIQTMSLEDQEEELRRLQAAERRENDQEVAWRPAAPVATAAAAAAVTNSTTTATSTAAPSSQTPPLGSASAEAQSQANNPANKQINSDNQDISKKSNTEDTNASTNPSNAGTLANNGDDSKDATVNQSQTSDNKQATDPSPSSSDQKPAAAGKYIPPASRNRMAGAGVAPPPSAAGGSLLEPRPLPGSTRARGLNPIMRGNKESLPDLSSKDAFPTLS